MTLLLSATPKNATCTFCLYLCVCAWNSNNYKSTQIDNLKSGISQRILKLPFNSMLKHLCVSNTHTETIPNTILLLVATLQRHNLLMLLSFVIPFKPKGVQWNRFPYSQKVLSMAHTQWNLWSFYELSWNRSTKTEILRNRQNTNYRGKS